MKYVRKRDGRLEPFNQERITNAIWKAAKAVGGKDRELAKKLSDQVIAELKKRFGEEGVPTVEEIQDLVEKILIENGHARTAKAYILYRKQHQDMRELAALLSSADMVDQYLEIEDWRVRENSNMSYSLQGLNNYLSSTVIAKYWITRIYPPNIAEAHFSGDIHIHDLGVLGPYCVGWDIKDLLLSGFGGVPGKIESKPAKHFRTALGQIVNFFYTLQGEAAGAQAFSFDPQTPIIIRRNKKLELVTLEMLFEDYRHLAVRTGLSEAIINNDGLYRCFNLHDFDKRKYLVSRLPTEDILFQKDTLEVLTPEGFKEVRAISRHKITSRNDKLLLVETEDGNILRVTRSHPIILANGKVKRADEIEEDEVILSKNINTRFSQEISLNPDFAWLIGFLIAEGCWGHQTRSVVVSVQKDSKVRKKLKEVLERLKIPFSDKYQYNVIFGTTSIGRFIRNHLKLQEHAHRKNFPEFILQLDEESIGNMLSGIIDGDGYVDRERTVRVVTTSYTLAMELKTILDILGINSTVRGNCPKKSNHKDYYVVRFRVPPSKLSLFSSSIKLKDIKPKIKVSPNFTSKVIKLQEAKSNSEYVYDITVEGQTFMINKIVAHNSNFDTYLAPFIRYDGLSQKEVEQALQEFFFNMNVPTRVGFQTPFTNVTLDLTIPEFMKEEPVIIGGEVVDYTYGDMEKEMEIFNRAYAEIMSQGDAKGRVFTFPIPTYNITKDFNWDSPTVQKIFEVTAKYGVPYFSNFINTDMKPEDVRSMCCRLRIDNRELRKRGGGFFGANPLTGSIGVVTLNLPRIGYLAKDEDEFFERLETLMEIAKDSLEIKRKALENFTENGLYPYSKRYLRGVKENFGKYWKNHFSTIGLVGMNEAILNLLGYNIATQEGLEFAVKVLTFMREKLADFQEETKNIYNLEATPAEGTSYRLARIDKRKYPDIIVANEKYLAKGAEPFYTNSSQLPVDHECDLFEALEHQEKLQTLYTGGTVFHIYLGEKLYSWKAAAELVKKVMWNSRLPYITLTPTFSICATHGYITGEHKQCPMCGAKCEVYSRVVGYLRPVDQWNDGKQAEFAIRKTFDKSVIMPAAAIQA